MVVSSSACWLWRFATWGLGENNVFPFLQNQKRAERFNNNQYGTIKLTKLTFFHPKAKYTISLELNLGLKNILIYCLKNLEHYLLDLEPQITISQSELGDGAASQNLKEIPCLQ